MKFVLICLVICSALEIADFLPYDNFRFFQQLRSRRVKRSESLGCNTQFSRATQPESFIKENIAPSPFYPPKGSGSVKVGRRFADGIPKPPQIIRLRANTPDPNPNEGRVELRTGSEWGMICDGYWDKTASDVACKELGFIKGARLTKRKSEFGVGKYKSDADVTVGKIRCTGKEASLSKCAYKKPKCPKSQTAGVVCYYNDGCPYGWTSYGGMCYRVEKGPKTFQEAEMACKKKNANLVYILNDMENNFISDMLKLRFQNVKAAWTGGIWKEKTGADGRRYGAWTWSGTIQTVDSKKNHAWFPGFYITMTGRRPIKPYRQRSCIALSSTFIDSEKGNSPMDTDYFWWDNISCKQKLPYICQRTNFQWRARSSASSCYRGNGADYRGTASRTTRGSLCEKWTTPTSLQNPQNTPGKGLGDHNFCRNPDGDVKPWCWIDSARGMFGYCDLKECAKTPEVSKPKGTVHPPYAGFGISDCRKEQFFCPSMYRYRYGCIEKRYVCDGRKDCNNKEDEDPEICKKYLCSKDQFYCQINNYCIKKSMRCDGNPDCSDAADEKDCPKVTDPLNAFTSTPNKKLNAPAKVYYIDKKKCAEKCLAPSRQGFVCKSFNFIPKGGDRYTDICELLQVSASEASNSLVPDSSATHWEFKNDCGSSMLFKCNNGKCIVKKHKCDFTDDCGDNSDEATCSSDKKFPPLVVRLASNDAKTPDWKGRVEVRYRGEWGLVCDEGFDLKDADVICKMLKFKRALKALKRTYQTFGRGNGNMLVSNLQCVGNEASIDQCNHGEWRKTKCRGYQVAGVVCAVNRACTSREFRCVKDQICVDLKKVCDGNFDCPDKTDEENCDLKVSLVGGSNNKEGRVRLVRNNIEGTICKDLFDDKDAKVVCRMLGYQGEARAADGKKYGKGTGVVWVDELGCTGTESTLKDCPKKTWAPTDCSHDEDVAVKCDVPPGTPPSGSKDAASKSFKCGTRPLKFPRGRVVGGFDALLGQFPWQIGIRRKGDDFTVHWCGGTIISHKWILSASHCYERPKNEYLVVAGDNDNNEEEGREQNFDIDLMLLHENYTGPPRYDYDITLLKVKPREGNRYIEFNDYVQPACLPKPSTTIQDAVECFVSGWGSVGEGRYPKILQAAGVPLISESDCRTMHRGAITSRMQCAGFRAGGIDSCQGDSGGPLVCKMKNGKYTAIGQTSWGLQCAAPNSPGVYAKVTYFLPWIKKTIEENGGL